MNSRLVGLPLRVWQQLPGKDSKFIMVGCPRDGVLWLGTDQARTARVALSGTPGWL
jgi:hypothetical protein